MFLSTTSGSVDACTASPEVNDRVRERDNERV
jgi:hypothetical protein